MAHLIQISYEDDTSTCHRTHAGAAAALLQRPAAIRNIWCRERSGRHYALTNETLDQEIRPRRRERNKAELVEVFEILAF